MSSASIRVAKESFNRPVAVIDIGASSIRMAIAEINDSGQVHHLENLSQAVTLGKDTFTRGAISKNSIEQCVRVLRSYDQLMREYGISRPDQVRVVATSAVREASNRLTFMDRVFIATGLEVEPLDESEVNRITYMGIQPQLQADPRLADRRVMVVEFGGGSTEILVVQSGDVLFSHTYRLGSLRLLEMMERVDASPGKHRWIMESQILRHIAFIGEQIPSDSSLEIVAIGGDVRFAANHLIEEWDVKDLTYLPVDELKQLTLRMSNWSGDEIAQRFGLGYQDAETVVPALLCYVLLAERFQKKQIAISDTNLRDGLLQSMAVGDAWTEDYRRQAIRSALTLCHRFDVDTKHACHVAELSSKLFAELQAEHQLDSRMNLILYLAAMLYDVGSYISSRSAHKHSMYIIRNSEMFGLSRKDVLLVSLVARYHRRSSPQPQHEGYAGLDRRERVAVAKLAALLRLAIALDDSRSQRISDIRCRVIHKRVIITVVGVEDVSLEQLAFREKGGLFEDVFGMQCQLRSAKRLI
jgi:exopolyphosphatase / guanosine-5'-triphosphate,3'-diphosphate pyrophosphatase